MNLSFSWTALLGDERALALRWGVGRAPPFCVRSDLPPGLQNSVPVERGKPPNDNAKEPKYPADNRFAQGHGENVTYPTSLSVLEAQHRPVLVFQTASDALLHDISDILKV